MDYGPLLSNSSRVPRRTPAFEDGGMIGTLSVDDNHTVRKKLGMRRSRVARTTLVQTLTSGNIWTQWFYLIALRLTFEPSQLCMIHIAQNVDLHKTSTLSVNIEVTWNECHLCARVRVGARARVKNYVSKAQSCDQCQVDE
jgi:hypothetical protein